MKQSLAALSAILLLSAGAEAQEGRSAQVESGRMVTDEEVSRFALIALVINQMANDRSLAPEQKQAAVAQAMERNGLQPARFKQITTASQNDPVLQQRIRAAAESHIRVVRRQQR